MSDESNNAPKAGQVEQPAAPAEVAAAKEEAAPATAEKIPESSSMPAVKPTAETEKPGEDSAAPAEVQTEKSAEKPDTEMKDAAERADVPAADAADDAAPAAPAEATTDTPDKAKARRKSTGVSDAKGKKLNKKASKARIVHLDAKPGDPFFVKLKGFPKWPAIICDEDMLPHALLKSRPVTARRSDGTYREDYADGGKRVADRTYPVMYLHTNEFGWVPNTDLEILDPETVSEIKTDKMRKDLQAAHQLASENHPLEYYKNVLAQYQEELIKQDEARNAKAATPAKKSKKPAKAEADEDEDVEMADAGDEEQIAVKEKKTKKRKAEEPAETPQRSDSVKKPKIKVVNNSTPKAANGASATPKSAKAQGEPKSASKQKPKKKEAEEKKAEKEVIALKEPELSPEEKHQRKEKEVLFLRHKLQKGLLTRDQEPKEEEMKLMSDYITKLEGFPDLEVSIIRATKINKVLKAILKLDTIPKEGEYTFKKRSQVLLDKWNKLLAVDGAPNSAGPAESANGVNGDAAPKENGKTNGVKGENGEAKSEQDKEESNEDKADKSAESEKPADDSADAEDKPVTEDAPKAPEAIEASA